jgi:hypothetical protein
MLEPSLVRLMQLPKDQLRAGNLIHALLVAYFGNFHHIVVEDVADSGPRGSTQIDVVHHLLKVRVSVHFLDVIHSCISASNSFVGSAFHDKKT